MVRDELLTSQGELQESKEELRAVKDELHDKTMLLDGLVVRPLRLQTRRNV